MWSVLFNDSDSHMLGRIDSITKILGKLGSRIVLANDLIHGRAQGYRERAEYRLAQATDRSRMERSG
jgi:hypothetical protein